VGWFVGGSYIYTEGSNSSRILLSPQLNLSPCSESSGHCFSFWYFVYGVASHTVLRMYTARQQVYARPEWTRHSPPGGTWTRGLIALRCGKPLQMVFVAEFGNTFSGVAVDDISFVPGQCDSSKCCCFMFFFAFLMPNLHLRPGHTWIPI